MRIKCPACAEVFVPELAREHEANGIEDDAPTTRSRDDGIAKKKKTKKKKAGASMAMIGLIAGGGVGFLLMCCGVGVGGFVWPGFLRIETKVAQNNAKTQDAGVPKAPENPAQNPKKKDQKEGVEQQPQQDPKHMPSQPLKQIPQTPALRHIGEDRIYDKNAGFSIVPLKGWKQVKNSKVLMHFLGPIEIAGANLNVVMGKHDGTPPKNVVDDLKQVYPNDFRNWKCLDEGPLMIDGKKTYFITWQATDKEKNVETRAIQYLVVSKDKFHGITFAASPMIFESLRKSFEASALSAQID
jgi:hypothetical protein